MVMQWSAGSNRGQMLRIALWPPNVAIWHLKALSNDATQLREPVCFCVCLCEYVRLCVSSSLLQGMWLKLCMGTGPKAQEHNLRSDPIKKSKVILRPSWFGNALYHQISYIGRTPDWSVMHCWGQRSCRGQPGVKLHRNARCYQIW